MYDARLASFVSQLKRELGGVDRIEAYAFWSPGSSGLSWHFDTGNAFVVQLEGTKRWRFAVRPALAFPPAPVMADDAQDYPAIYPWALVAGVETCEISEATLRPGDVLYLPPGTWHTTRADSREGSLGITIAIFGTPLHEVVGRWFAEALMARPEWRRPAGCWPARDGGAARDATLAERFAALQELARSLTLEELSARCLGSDPSNASIVPESTSVLLDEECLLRLKGPLHVRPGSDDRGEACLAVEAGGETANLGIECLRLLEGLASTAGAFAAGAAVSWKVPGDTQEWDHVAPVLAGLLARKVLERVAADPAGLSCPTR